MTTFDKVSLAALLITAAICFYMGLIGGVE